MGRQIKDVTKVATETFSLLRLSITTDDLRTILQIQKAHSDPNQMRLLSELTQKFSLHFTSTSQPDIYEGIANSICESNYDPESGIIFDS